MTNDLTNIKNLYFVEDILIRFQDDSLINNVRVSMCLNSILIEFRMNPELIGFEKMKLYDDIISILKRRFYYIHTHGMDIYIDSIGYDYNEYYNKKYVYVTYDMLDKEFSGVKRNWFNCFFDCFFGYYTYTKKRDVHSQYENMYFMRYFKKTKKLELYHETFRTLDVYILHLYRCRFLNERDILSILNTYISKKFNLDIKDE